MVVFPIAIAFLLAIAMPIVPEGATVNQPVAGAPAAGIADISECHAGQYDPAAGASCTDADLGYYVPADGAVSEIPADVGHYVPNAGAIAQSACSAGSYQPGTGQSSCLLAAQGYFVPNGGAIAELACPDLEITSVVGSTACRVMSDLERLAVLKSYVTGKGPGGCLGRLVDAARAALVKNDLPAVRNELTLLKKKARAESGRTLSAAEARTIAGEADEILVWRVPILGYHFTVCPTPKVPKASRYLYVCPDTFRAELQLLIDNGWTFVTGAEFAVDFVAGIRLAPKTAVITIDGTEAGDHDVAFPILADLGIHATFFISPGLLGKPGKQTWATVEEMAMAGQDIENHGMFHKTLTNLHGAALAAEIRDGSDAIETHLGYLPSVFCYANGKFNDSVVSAVSNTPGMSVAVHTNSLDLEDPAQPMRMQRLSVRGEYTPADLLAMLAPHASG